MTSILHIYNYKNELVNTLELTEQQAVEALVTTLLQRECGYKKANKLNYVYGKNGQHEVKITRYFYNRYGDISHTYKYHLKGELIDKLLS